MDKIIMASAVNLEQNREATDRNSRGNQKNVLTGDLPADFLRVDGIQPGPPAVAVQPQMIASPFGMPAYYQKGGILSITVVQARLAKNYGLARMDPYCRLRVGTSLFETPTDYNGAKNPRWNKLIQCPVPEGVNQVYIEIFDECTFTVDERIAWGLIVVKDEIFAGETVDDWYSLSGKQGEDKEGMINVILQYREATVPAGPGLYPQPMMLYQQPMLYSYPAVVTTTTTVPPSGQQPAAVDMTAQTQTVQLSETDVKTIKELFPDMDEEIVRSVLISSGGNMDSAVNNLLNMSGER